MGQSEPSAEFVSFYGLIAFCDEFAVGSWTSGVDLPIVVGVGGSDDRFAFRCGEGFEWDLDFASFHGGIPQSEREEPHGRVPSLRILSLLACSPWLGGDYSQYSPQKIFAQPLTGTS